MTETLFLSVAPLGEPVDMGPDDAGNAQCVFTVIATKRPSATFVQELIAVLEAAGVGRSGIDLLAGSGAVVPDTLDRPILFVRAIGGQAPLGTHNDGAAAYRRPGAQLMVRSDTTASANEMAQAAYAALVAVRNQAVAV